MFSHRPVFLHQVSLNEFMQNVSVELAEDFAVVSGLNYNTGGPMTLLPICDNSQADYLIPNGVDGLPYVADLGRPGGVAQVKFPSAVCGITVATYSAMRPAVTLSPFVTSRGGYPNSPGEDGLYTSGVVLVDGGLSFNVTFAPEKEAAAFNSVFRVGTPWKGVNGYPGYIITRQ